jgi:pimeloyl-ACP methyl ester carboxylesterase
MTHRRKRPAASVGAVMLSLPSGQVYVEAHGSGDVVVCVPGLSANCRSFDLIVPGLVEAGKQVVVMDLRGRGRSEVSSPGTYGWERHAQDVLAVAEQFGTAAPTIVGHSMGAFIGLDLAARQPERCRRLILIDAAGRPDPAALTPIGKSLARLGRTYLSAQQLLTTMFAGNELIPDDSFWRRYFGWEMAQQADGSVAISTDLAAVTEDAQYGATQDVYDRWPRLRRPVLLLRALQPMVGELGFVVTEADAQRFAATVPGATVLGIDANHYTIIAHPATSQAITDFVIREP